MFRTVQAKLFAGTGLVLLGFVGLSLTSISVLTGRSAEASIARELAAARIASQRYLSLRSDVLVTRARAVAQTPYLKATLTIDELDRETAFATARQLSEVAETPLLLLVDARARLLADAADSTAPYVDLVDTPAIAAAIEGEERSATWSYGERDYLVAASPVIVGDLVVGIVVVGVLADDVLAHELREIAGADVFLVRSQSVIGMARDTSAPPITTAEVVDVVARTQATTDRPAVESGSAVPWDDDERATTVPLGQGVTLVLTRTLGDVLLLHRQQRLWLLGALLVAAMIALLASRVVAARLCRPIVDLTRASEALGRGDLTVSVPEEGLDELGVMSVGFNRMAARIARLVSESRDHLAALQAQQDQLEHARDAAESANRAKSAFLANMSHELRTPLNAIIGYSELLIEDSGDTQTSTNADLRRILSSARHLLRLVTEVLDLSKVEAGRESLEVEAVDLAGMLEQVLSEVAPLAAKNRNTVRLGAALAGGDIVTDGLKLRQVLLNLLSNACKFTTDGTITVRAERTATDGGDLVTVSVTDTGIGVDPERLDAIFEPFIQADGSTARRYGGTGLGLTLSRSYCRLMGGALTATAAPGLGSTFTATIRVERGSTAPATAQASAA